MVFSLLAGLERLNQISDALRSLRAVVDVEQLKALLAMVLVEGRHENASHSLGDPLSKVHSDAFLVRLRLLAGAAYRLTWASRAFSRYRRRLIVHLKGQAESIRVSR
jgi:hypothetical protein